MPAQTSLGPTLLAVPYLRSPADSLTRLRLPGDTVERHELVAQLVGAPGTLLDVGGVSGQLAAFLPGTSVTVINVNADGDLRYDGESLPFAGATFEVVTSLDVLEHVAPDRRENHLREALRVARRLLVSCCPVGTPEHVENERSSAAWYERMTGAPHPFLAEHLVLGLPTVAELERLAAAVGGELRFHGDFRRTDAAFRTAMLARHRPGPGTLWRYGRERLGRSTSSLELSSRAGPYANRAYISAGA